MSKIKKEILKEILKEIKSLLDAGHWDFTTNTTLLNEHSNYKAINFLSKQKFSLHTILKALNNYIGDDIDEIINSNNITNKDKAEKIAKLLANDIAFDRIDRYITNDPIYNPTKWYLNETTIFTLY